jgi:hypothetical protein
MTPSSIHSMRSHSGGPLGTHSYHSLLGFLHALFPGIGRSIVGACFLVVSVTFHVAIVHFDRTPRTLVILVIHSRGSCQFRLPPTINSFGSLFAWLVVHSIGLHGLSVIRLTWLNSHGLFSLDCSSSRKHSTFRTLVVGSVVSVFVHVDHCPFRSDSHGLLMIHSR